MFSSSLTVAEYESAFNFRYLKVFEKSFHSTKYQNLTILDFVQDHLKIPAIFPNDETE